MAILGPLQAFGRLWLRLRGVRSVLEDSRLVRGYPSKPEVLRVNFDKAFGGDPASNLVMYEGDVLFIPESWGSDVLETVSRVLGPVSGAIPVASQIYTASQIGK